MDEAGCGVATTGKAPGALPFAGEDEVKLGRGAIADGIGVADAIATPTGGAAARGGTVETPVDGTVAGGGVVVTAASARLGIVGAGVAAAVVASRPGSDA